MILKHAEPLPGAPSTPSSTYPKSLPLVHCPLIQKGSNPAVEPITGSSAFVTQPSTENTGKSVLKILHICNSQCGIYEGTGLSESENMYF